jgi:hypothetical protein
MTEKFKFKTVEDDGEDIIKKGEEVEVSENEENLLDPEENKDDSTGFDERIDHEGK